MKSNIKLRDDVPIYPTILHAVQAAAEMAPDRDALICEDTRVTYAQYERAVGGLAKQLPGRAPQRAGCKEWQSDRRLSVGVLIRDQYIRD